MCTYIRTYVRMNTTFYNFCTTCTYIRMYIYNDVYMFKYYKILILIFFLSTVPGRNRLFDYFLLTLTISCALGLWWSLKQKKQAEKRVSTLLWNLNSAEECLQQLQSSM